MKVNGKDYPIYYGKENMFETTDQLGSKRDHLLPLSAGLGRVVSKRKDKEDDSWMAPRPFRSTLRCRKTGKPQSLEIC
jgi:hypothetical protein